jgi:hypothetical protein
MALMNPAIRARLAQLEALERRVGHDAAAEADLRRVEMLSPEARAAEYRRRLDQLPPPDPAEVERLRSMSAQELVGEFYKVLRRGASR